MNSFLNHSLLGTLSIRLGKIPGSCHSIKENYANNVFFNSESIRIYFDLKKTGSLI